MVEAGYFDPKKRAIEKQKLRELDEYLLKHGLISADELAKRNGLFSSFDPKQMKIVRRRIEGSGLD